MILATPRSIREASYCDVRELLTAWADADGWNNRGERLSSLCDGISVMVSHELERLSTCFGTDIEKSKQQIFDAANLVRDLMRERAEIKTP